MRWSYKTVHYELKKEGLLGGTFLDESEMEQSLNEYGKAGWELVSVIEMVGGVVAVFKQPLALGAFSQVSEEQTRRSSKADEFVPAGTVNTAPPVAENNARPSLRPARRSVAEAEVETAREQSPTVRNSRLQQESMQKASYDEPAPSRRSVDIRDTRGMRDARDAGDIHEDKDADPFMADILEELEEPLLPEDLFEEQIEEPAAVVPLRKKAGVRDVRDARDDHHGETRDDSESARNKKGNEVGAIRIE